MPEPTTTLTPASAGAATPLLPRWLHWLALLLLCAAYLQGGLVKLADFRGAVAEMQHFGLSPAVPMALATIVLELGACAMILLGWRRWLGALALAAFTLAATFVANRFWQAPPEARFMMANAFFEHLGLVGGFLLVAWHELRERARRAQAAQTRR
ncbi:DoxX family protein [Cupriavidus alkaliphilus]|uniref:DoxX family protein n=1 Tax=Cupriavidus alkaliphilus TaxID=942866 RepID=UPI000DC2A392|nr:DoxX family protein [Cupriavidus alkaliphilus]RAS09360.1 putative membrane protein YphA (DoxX/SURF4 family) [Cupriavidus alkaliphilus]